MLIYCKKFLKGEFSGADAEQVTNIFTNMQASPYTMTIAMAIIVTGCFAVCSFGLKIRQSEAAIP